METALKTFTALLRHDNGTIRLSTTAASPEQAVIAIARAEDCPEHAVTII